MTDPSPVAPAKGDTPEMVTRALQAMDDAVSEFETGRVAAVPYSTAQGQAMVRAVIEALREPTEAMDRAGNRATCSDIRCTCEETQIYRAYIDAALK